MKLSTAVGASVALAPTVLGQTLTASMIESMGNNSLFTRWRPTSHIIAPAGWQNDPCGPMYDPTMDLYHIFYQWHPEHINWGNISWGHATSKDLISWTDVTGWQGSEALALGPTGNGSYNGLGIFSGTAQPVNIYGQQNGSLLAMYTSVSYLPTSWNAYYKPGTESQSLATSDDGGVTWQEYAGNPVITGPPGDWNITGFRDPFLQPWPAMDAILAQDEPHYYAVFGSGIKGVGPRMPLWSAPATNLTQWTFLGALWEPADNTSLGSVAATQTYGYNFEVSGAFDLPDADGNLHYFVNFGAEGNNVTDHEYSHSALWNAGAMNRRANGSAVFTPLAGGAADPGLLYALTSFNDTKNDRRILIGWAPEDIVGDGGIFSANQQGFQGSLSLPRELFVHQTSGVVNVNGSLTALGPNWLTQQPNGTFTAYTLGQRPVAEVVTGLRNGTTQHSFAGRTFNSSTTLLSNGSSHFELRATILSQTGPAGLRIAANPDGSEYTTISYSPSNNTVTVDRSHSSTIDQFNNASNIGYFLPYTLSSPYSASYSNSSSQDVQEALHWTVYLDGSLLEVYLNDRFALTTRIYPASLASTGVGIFVDGGASAVVQSVDFWGGLYNVFPERPVNSSAALVWDSAEETGNYTWWSGN